MNINLVGLDAFTGFIQASLSKIQGFFRPSKDYPNTYMNTHKIFNDCEIQEIHVRLALKMYLTTKASITTAADDKCCDIFPNFRKNK